MSVSLRMIGSGSCANITDPVECISLCLTQGMSLLLQDAGEPGAGQHAEAYAAAAAHCNLIAICCDSSNSQPGQAAGPWPNGRSTHAVRGASRRCCCQYAPTTWYCGAAACCQPARACGFSRSDGTDACKGPAAGSGGCRAVSRRWLLRAGRSASCQRCWSGSCTCRRRHRCPTAPTQQPHRSPAWPTGCTDRCRHGQRRHPRSVPSHCSRGAGRSAPQQRRAAVAATTAPGRHVRRGGAAAGVRDVSAAVHGAAPASDCTTSLSARQQGTFTSWS